MTQLLNNILMFIVCYLEYEKYRTNGFYIRDMNYIYMFIKFLY